MADNTTITGVLAAMQLEHAKMKAGTLPDLRNVLKVLEHADINDVCPASGLTPLLWTIEHDSPLISFILARGADLATKGTGDFAMAPVDLALAKGLMTRAEQLVDRGAPCPPEVAERIAARRRAVREAEQEQKQTELTLERALKGPEFLKLAATFSDRFGVEAKKTRGRKGQLSFKGVPVRKLARDAGKSEAAWLGDLNAETAAAGATLFAPVPIEEKAKIELCLAPTLEKRQILFVSQLLTGEITVPLERKEHADLLDALAGDCPFTIVSCGRLGVIGKPDRLPGDTASLAERLFDICPELLGHYAGEYDRKHKIMPPAPPPDRAELVAALAGDLKTDGYFWLPWGVEL